MRSPLIFRRLQVPGIYAVQHNPELVEVNDTIKLAINLGLNFEGEVESEVSVADLQRLSLQFAQSPVPQVLNYLFKSLLKTTVYSTKPGTHFGLAIENGYTHAVSPLRRYPDILVQRVLHEVFANGRDRKTSRAKEVVNLTSSSCHGQIRLERAHTNGSTRTRGANFRIDRSFERSHQNRPRCGKRSRWTPKS